MNEKLKHDALIVREKLMRKWQKVKGFEELQVFSARGYGTIILLTIKHKEKTCIIRAYPKGGFMPPAENRKLLRSYLLDANAELKYGLKELRGKMEGMK